jgi:hypothetical protein
MVQRYGCPVLGKTAAVLVPVECFGRRRGAAGDIEPLGGRQRRGHLCCVTLALRNTSCPTSERSRTTPSVRWASVGSLQGWSQEQMVSEDVLSCRKREYGQRILILVAPEFLSRPPSPLASHSVRLPRDATASLPALRRTVRSKQT